MPNPIMRKNPWMSLWLSAANAWSGAAGGAVCSRDSSAEMHRQQVAMGSEIARQMVRIWAATWIAPPSRDKRGRSR